MIKKIMKAGMKSAMPKGRITPVYKPAMPVKAKTGGAISDMEVKMIQKKLPKKNLIPMKPLKTEMPKRAMPVRPTRYMNPKNLA